MVSVSNVGQAAAASTKQASKTTLDYEAFLKLFVEQLKHQDPTAPMDAAQSLAQLATFSQVEQSVATNKKLDSLLSAHSLSQANGLIGRTATSADGQVSGAIVSVRVTDEGALATLGSGETLLLGGGVSIS
ncbi:flagellar basal-body rod modification protein FlgD [Pseudochelatococcus lubricantis]|uniref:Basal-body rod modification protein FlgD n=1 Tax=Pseudochelatococcus lubricantis TaxID=1538102 RepID=A0ABX0UVY9_9HYPH|nr:flagellar hook assembly protein FlgD [Pseudochelatococcus lubricantis]NIJ57122.1 flagellar basal-body rod modification protein FlgD [Pseudochelatococcus lubricantis]